MRQLRILLVEDDVVLSALITEVLAGLGHRVCATARTEQEAIDAAARETPDLMIVDARLETGSGVSAMDAVLERGPMPHIFMTGGSRQLIPLRATVLHKPFGAAMLMAALEQVAGLVADPPST